MSPATIARKHLVGVCLFSLLYFLPQAGALIFLTSSANSGKLGDAVMDLCFLLYLPVPVFIKAFVPENAVKTFGEYMFLSWWVGAIVYSIGLGAASWVIRVWLKHLRG